MCFFIFDTAIKYVINITRKVIEQLIKLPEKMGVYLFKDEKDDVIFVNMAENLSKEARKHFHSKKRMDLIIKSKTKSIEIHITKDQIETAKLELELIKKFHPPLNQRGHDQKQYRFIEITTTEKYPSSTVRKILSEKQVKTLGPYPKKSTIRHLFNFAINYYRIANCRQIIVTGKKNKIVSTCLRRKTKQCYRPCEIEIDKKEYDNQISNFIKFFEGEFPEIIDELELKMKEYTHNYEFEKAGLVRDNINSIKQHIKFK